MGYRTWDQVKRRKRIRNILLIVLALLLLGGAGYGGYQYYRVWKERKQERKYEELRERAFVTGTPTPTPEEIVKATATPTPTHAPTAEEMLYAALYERYEEYFTIQPDFTILHAENEDVFAYISVPGTKVDYPILANEIEDYYLDYNIDHTKGYPGCLYIQNCNSKTLDDRFVIVYGHNMRDGTMFGSLQSYNDVAFLEEHPYFFVYQENRVMAYEIAVISHVGTEHLLSDDYVKVNGVWEFDKFDGFETARLLERVRKDDGKRCYIATPEPTDEDNMMVLSTCGEGKRFIVVGKRVLDISTVGGLPAPLKISDSENE